MKNQKRVVIELNEDGLFVRRIAAGVCVIVNDFTSEKGRKISRDGHRYDQRALKGGGR